MPTNRSAPINLIKDSGGSFFDRFTDWALTIGRLLVILTEIVALSSFIYRFTLDRQLIDLHSKIKQEQAVVSLLKNNEETYRNLQDRLKMVSDSYDSRDNKAGMLEDIVGFAPKGMVFNDISITEGSISVDANFAFVSSLREFVNSLKSYEGIKNVSIDRIENRLSNAQIAATIRADFGKRR